MAITSRFSFGLMSTVAVIGMLTIAATADDGMQSPVHRDGNSLAADGGLAPHSILRHQQAGRLQAPVSRATENEVRAPAVFSSAGLAVNIQTQGSPVSGDPQDCNGNGIPDECDINCGEPESPCDIPGCGGSLDCDGNGIPDDCCCLGPIPVGYLYQHDDGTHENSVGLTGEARLAWLNHFTIEAGAETIASISVAWGLLPDGMPTEFYLWSDPNGDGDPTDAQVLAMVATVSANTNTDILTTLDITPTNVGPAGTSFFVGALITIVPGEFPTSLDEDGALQGQSWVAADTSGVLDPNNLGAGDIPPLLIDDAGLPGNWLIRATASVECADCNDNCIPDSCDLADCDGSPWCSDCDGNGIPDECDLEGCDGSTWCQDCNGNGLPDLCDLDNEPCEADGGARDAGDTCADAFLIETLPFNHTGTTVGYIDDYDEECPFSGSISPDVVYEYTPSENCTVEISLCGPATDYDTKLYVYEGSCPGTLVACNDDACPSFLSELSDAYNAAVPLTGGLTYYIIVDGWLDDAGNYEIAVTGNCGAGDSGNCCADHCGEGPGCEDPVCEASVCTTDPWCCDVCWDSLCAGYAADDPNCYCDSGGGCTIHLEILTDDFPSETTWELVQEGYGTIASGGPLDAPATLHTWDIPVECQGCFTFTIFDSYGDGICCAFGNGAYSVSFEDSPICSGSEFGAQESCVNFGDGCGPAEDPCPLLIRQPPNQSNGIFSDLHCDLCGGGVQILAEQFVVSQEVTITELRVWGGYFPDNIPSPPDMAVIFHADDAGSPGAEIAGEFAVPTVQAMTGATLFGVDEYLLTMTLTNPVVLGPGTFWLQTYHNTAGNTDSFFWEVGGLDPVSGLIGSAFSFTNPPGPWEVDPVTDLAFELTCGTPPPPNDCNENGIPDECDIADQRSTDCNLNCIPDECEGPPGTVTCAGIDVKPGSCPNPFNVNGSPNSRGKLPVALTGTDTFDVNLIDISTLRLFRTGHDGQVAPLEGPPGPHTVIADVATPFEGDDCTCHELTGDGLLDLSMKFPRQEIISALGLGDLPHGSFVPLALRGNLIGGAAFTTPVDCILIVPLGPAGALVQSTVPDLPVQISPPDLNAQGSGPADLTRLYAPGTVVTLTAPATANGHVFQGWLVDGLMLKPGAATIRLTVLGDLTARAVYRAPAASPNLAPRHHPTAR